MLFLIIAKLLISKIWDKCLATVTLMQTTDLVLMISPNVHSELRLSCEFKLVQFFLWPQTYLQFSHSVVSDSLQPHGLQHTRLPCPSPTPRACSNSGPSSHWCHPTISSSVISFSFCLQSFPASRSLPMSQFFVSGGQSIGVSASASVLPMNTDWLDLLAVQGSLKSLLQHHSSKAQLSL